MQANPLLYNPMNDIYYSTFRLLSILLNVKDNIEYDRYRIMDFYYLFPDTIATGFKWRDSYSNHINKKDFNLFTSKLDNNKIKILNKKNLFYRTRNIHDSSVKILISRGLLDSDSFKINKKLKVTGNLKNLNIYSDIKKEKEDASSKLIFSFLDLLLAEDLVSKGKISEDDGLKARSGLMEYIYDEK